MVVSFLATLGYLVGSGGEFSIRDNKSEDEIAAGLFDEHFALARKVRRWSLRLLFPAFALTLVLSPFVEWT